MAELRTELQRDVFGTICLLVAAKPSRRGVTTRELTGELDRVGQVIGHSCGELVARGLLTRVAPATYAVTRGGLGAIPELEGWSHRGRRIRLASRDLRVGRPGEKCCRSCGRLAARGGYCRYCGEPLSLDPLFATPIEAEG